MEVIIRDTVEAATELTARIIAAELEALDDTRPAHQLRAIQEKRDSLVGVLNSRLEAGEMTYARYLSSAQHVYLAALENLREVAVAEQSVSAIDDNYIDQRLEELVDHEGEAAIVERSSGSWSEDP